MPNNGLLTTTAGTVLWGARPDFQELCLLAHYVEDGLGGARRPRARFVEALSVRG
jgi:hypothetical protein